MQWFFLRNPHIVTPVFCFGLRMAAYKILIQRKSKGKFVCKWSTDGLKFQCLPIPKCPINDSRQSIGGGTGRRSRGTCSVACRLRGSVRSLTWGLELNRLGRLMRCFWRLGGCRGYWGGGGLRQPLAMPFGVQFELLLESFGGAFGQRLVILVRNWETGVVKSEWASSRLPP